MYCQYKYNIMRKIKNFISACILIVVILIGLIIFFSPILLLTLYNDPVLLFLFTVSWLPTLVYYSIFITIIKIANY